VGGVGERQAMSKAQRWAARAAADGAGGGGGGESVTKAQRWAARAVAPVAPPLQQVQQQAEREVLVSSRWGLVGSIGV
jgi:hypothetical protein